MTPRRARLDSSLEAAGAEFLVLGLLLVEGIQASKAYQNFPGYDIVAVNPDAGRSCRIQVKSRWATDYGGGFIIRSYDTDFVVFVALNRGYRYRRRPKIDDEGRRPPQVYVFPAQVVHSARSRKSKWGKVFLRDIEDVECYLENWRLVKEALDLPTGRRPPT